AAAPASWADFASAALPAAGAGLSARCSSAFCTWYLIILRSILMVIVSSWELRSAHASQAPVVPVLDRIEQVGRGVDLAVVVDLLVTAGLEHRPVVDRAPVGGGLERLLLRQHAREGVV